MLAVITGDIVNSRNLPDKSVWLDRLKEILGQPGEKQEGRRWQIYRGDSFQAERARPEEALQAALRIRAGLKALPDFAKLKMDVRMAIGIGAPGYQAAAVPESDGEAYLLSGHTLDGLKKADGTIALRTVWPDLNEEMQVSLRLANALMSEWSQASAETAYHLLTQPLTQQELADKLALTQPTIHWRIAKSHIEAILLLEQRFRTRVLALLENPK